MGLPRKKQRHAYFAKYLASLDEATLAHLSDEAQARVMLTDDFHEGPVAFIEKRAPRWVGR